VSSARVLVAAFRPVAQAEHPLWVSAALGSAKKGGGVKDAVAWGVLVWLAVGLFCFGVGAYLPISLLTELILCSGHDCGSYYESLFMMAVFLAVLLFFSQPLLSSIVIFMQSIRTARRVYYDGEVITVKGYYGRKFMFTLGQVSMVDEFGLNWLGRYGLAGHMTVKDYKIKLEEGGYFYFNGEVSLTPLSLDANNYKVTLKTGGYFYLSGTMPNISDLIDVLTKDKELVANASHPELPQAPSEESLVEPYSDQNEGIHPIWVSVVLEGTKETVVRFVFSVFVIGYAIYPTFTATLCNETRHCGPYLFLFIWLLSWGLITYYILSIISRIVIFTKAIRTARRVHYDGEVIIVKSYYGRKITFTLYQVKLVEEFRLNRLNRYVALVQYHTVKDYKVELEEGGYFHLNGEISTTPLSLDTNNYKVTLNTGRYFYLSGTMSNIAELIELLRGKECAPHANDLSIG